ncbi:MAG: diguanylate cyclase, partial [Actinomycetota bacterium]|nr:diguanylate cyclase [Actinomycetota bacterium]
RECDTLARHGGDEYVMLLEELVDREQVIAIGQRVLAGFSGPVESTVGRIPMSASIGIHLADDHDDYDSLLRSADGAMYQAKRSGGSAVRFSSSEP